MPLKVAFELEQQEFFFHFLEKVFSFLLILEIIINFNTGVYMHGMIVYDRKKIAKFYILHQNFFIHFFSTIFFIIFSNNKARAGF
jgi:hypothetical protein